MKMKKILMIGLLIVSFQAESKMFESVDSNGNITCEIDSNGGLEFIDGPCWTTNFYAKEFMCETESGEELKVSKEIFRIDNYTVKAFGNEYFGIKGSGPGIANGLTVKSKLEIEYGEPVSLVFKSSSLGNPVSVAIHIQGGRAPLIEQISCYPL